MRRSSRHAHASVARKASLALRTLLIDAVAWRSEVARIRERVTHAKGSHGREPNEVLHRITFLCAHTSAPHSLLNVRDVRGEPFTRKTTTHVVSPA